MGRAGVRETLTQGRPLLRPSPSIRNLLTSKPNPT